MSLQLQKTIVVLMLVLLYSSCKDDADGPECPEISDPLTEIPDLKKIVETGTIAWGNEACCECSLYAGTKIYSGRYKGKRTYIVTNIASSIFTCQGQVYNCFGEKELNASEDFALWAEIRSMDPDIVKDVEVLWEKQP